MSVDPVTGREYLSVGEFQCRYSPEVSLIDFIEIMQAIEFDECKENVIEYVARLIRSRYDLRELREKLSRNKFGVLAIPGYE